MKPHHFLVPAFALATLAGCATPPENCRYVSDPLDTRAYKQDHPWKDNNNVKRATGKDISPSNLAAHPFVLEGDLKRSRGRWICEPAPEQK
jgi:hypothetical protein